MKEILRTKYPKLGREICELLPNKTYEQIKRYAQKEGVSIRKHWTWTPSEENIIRTKGPVIGNKIGSLIPNKTPVAIKSKMARMRIKVIHQAPPPLVLSEINSIRLAAFIDGEGAVGIEKQRCIGKEREGYSPFVEIGNTNIKLKEWLESVITTIHINWKVRDVGPPRRVAYIMDIHFLHMHS